MSNQPMKTLTIDGTTYEIVDDSARSSITTLQALAGAPLTANTVSAMVDTTKVYVYTGSESGYTSGNWYYWSGSAWTSGGVYNSQGIGDGTITNEKLADSTVKLEKLHSEVIAAIGSGSGLTEDIKQALLQCFGYVAWINDQGQTYYEALQSALYPPADLSSISCVYTQSGTVYDTDSLDSLKTDLVVTAHYTDSSTATVTAYTLSGTLTEGTSTITVTYGGKTTTFSVTVSASSDLMYSLYNHEFAGVVDGVSDAINSNIKLMDTDKTFTLLMDATSTGMTDIHWRLFSGLEATSPYNGIYYGARSTQTSYDMLKWCSNSVYNMTPFTYNYVGNIKMALTHEASSGSLAYKIKVDNNATVSGTVNSTFISNEEYLIVGGTGNLAWGFKGTMNLFEVYNKILTSSEINEFIGDS